MPLSFNMLLDEAGVSPAEVRLLRHQPLVAGRALTELWRCDRPTFEEYQRHQRPDQRASFDRPFWASFIGTADGRTLFAGLYEVSAPVAVEDWTGVFADAPHAPGTFDRYTVTPSPLLADYAGRLYIDWGGGASGRRAWTQRAELQNKAISELRLDQAEPPFPGLMQLTAALSSLPAMPPAWWQALSEARGVYLLTCPRDGSLYVGSATGEGGFASRWDIYRANGHGGNVALLGRPRSDFLVSVLHVAGSADTSDQILAAEAVWKQKLQSRTLGFNRN